MSKRQDLFDQIWILIPRINWPNSDRISTSQYFSKNWKLYQFFCKLNRDITYIWLCVKNSDNFLCDPFKIQKRHFNLNFWGYRIPQVFISKSFINLVSQLHIFGWYIPSIYFSERQIGNIWRKSYEDQMSRENVNQFVYLCCRNWIYILLKFVMIIKLFFKINHNWKRNNFLLDFIIFIIIECILIWD